MAKIESDPRMEYIRLAKEEITEGMFKSIKEAFERSVKVRDSVLEEATNLDFYVSIIILLSFDYAYGDLIDSGIRQCEFLQKDYYATNVEIPDDSRIRDWLDGKLDDEEYYQGTRT